MYNTIYVLKKQLKSIYNSILKCSKSDLAQLRVRPLFFYSSMNNSGTLNNISLISSLTDCFPQFKSDFFNL